MALSDVTGTANFNAYLLGASNLNEDGNTTVKTVKLDDFIQEQVSLIKLDVEGSEYATLNGAKRIIKEDKPFLAISIYHRHDDLYRLPLLIHEMVPEYKFYLRHHSTSYKETVLYAKI